MSTNDALKNAITPKVPETQVTEQPVILQYLNKYKGQVEAALPKHLTVERMVRLITTEVRKVPALLSCDPTSLFGAIIQCSQLGLEPGNALGHAYLLPFKNTKQKTTDVQLIIGYKGMIDLARRSGQVTSINVFAVYPRDEFKVQYGLDPKITHERNIKIDISNEKPIAFYAVANLRGGATQFELMTVPEIDKIRDSSKGAFYTDYKTGAVTPIASSPWHSHYNEMAKKTVIRRLFKYLPVSIEFQTAISLDEMADAGIDQQNKANIFPDAIDLDTLKEETDFPLSNEKSE